MLNNPKKYNKNPNFIIEIEKKKISKNCLCSREPPRTTPNKTKLKVTHKKQQQKKERLQKEERAFVYAKGKAKNKKLHPAAL